MRRATHVHQRRVRNRIEVFRHIGVHDLGVPLIDRLVDGPNRIERTPLGAVPIGRLIEVRFENRFEHQRRRGLYDPVADSRNPERALAHATGLRNHHPSDRLRCVASCSNLLPQFVEPALHSVVLDAREGLSVHARRPAVRTAAAHRRGRGCLHATPCHTGSGTAASAPAWPSRRALVGASESFQELPGSRQSPHLGSFERTPNQGSFPPPALPGFIGRMSPSDACRARLPMEPLPGRPDSPTGLPCCESPRVRTCCAHYPGEQDDPHMSVHPVVLGGLRLFERRLGARINLSRPAQASLALRPARLLTRPRRASVPGASMARSPSPSPG